VVAALKAAAADRLAAAQAVLGLGLAERSVSEPLPHTMSAWCSMRSTANSSVRFTKTRSRRSRASITGSREAFRVTVLAMSRDEDAEDAESSERERTEREWRSEIVPKLPPLVNGHPDPDVRSRRRAECCLASVEADASGIRRHTHRGS
jgi:hypothetical protein